MTGILSRTLLFALVHVAFIGMGAMFYTISPATSPQTVALSSQ